MCLCACAYGVDEYTKMTKQEIVIQGKMWKKWP